MLTSFNMHVSPCKEGHARDAMNQANAGAVCHPATNSNYDFCSVSLVRPFVLVPSRGYGKHFNLYVWEMKKYMLMVEKILIPILLKSLLHQLSYVFHTSCVVFSCLADEALFKGFSSFFSRDLYANVTSQPTARDMVWCQIKSLQVLRSVPCLCPYCTCLFLEPFRVRLKMFSSGLICQFTCPRFINPNYKCPLVPLEENKKE